MHTPLIMTYTVQSPQKINEGSVDPDLTKPISDIREKWKLLPAFLQV